MFATGTETTESAKDAIEQVDAKVTRPMVKPPLPTPGM